MRSCVICRSESFDRAGHFQVGLWDKTADGSLKPEDIDVVFGQCRACGHAQALTHYDSAMFARLYRDPRPVFWTDDPAVDPQQSYMDMVEAIVPYLPQTESRELSDTPFVAVDFGCGHGDLLRLLSQRLGPQLEGQDVALWGVDFENQVPDDVQFVKTDLNHLDHEALRQVPHDCALICATHLLEHLIEPEAFLAAAKQKLGPQGVLFLEVPDCAVFTAEQARNYNGIVNGQHIHYFTTASLTRLLVQSGFDVVAVKNIATGYSRRLLVVARPMGAGAAGQVIQFTNAEQAKAREALIDQALEATMPVALWGVGLDFRILMRDHERFSQVLELPDIQIFDQALAGQRIANKGIQSSQNIFEFEGIVFATPLSADVRRSMRRFYEKNKTETSPDVVDVYRPDVWRFSV